MRSFKNQKNRAIFRKSYYRSLIRNLIILILTGIFFISINSFEFNLSDFFDFSIIMIIFIFNIIRDLYNLRNLDKIIERRAICPLCGKEYLANKKSYLKVKELAESRPELKIDIHEILCCKCYQKFMNDKKNKLELKYYNASRILEL